MIIIFHDFSSLSPTAQSILGDWSASLSIAADKRFKFGESYSMPEQARTIAENCHAADSAANANASDALVRPVLN